MDLQTDKVRSLVEIFHKKIQISISTIFIIAYPYLDLDF